MRFTNLIAMSFLFAALSVGAAESKSVNVAKGAYSVQAPEAWIVSADADFGAVTLFDKPDSECALILSPPNPAVHASQLIAMELATLSQAGVDVQILQGFMDTVDGNMRIRVHFAAPLDDSEALMGLMYVVTLDDFVVMAAATAPDSQFDAFVADAEKIMESVALDARVIQAQRAELMENGEQLKEDTIRELLGDNYDNPEMREKMLEFLDNMELFELPGEEETAPELKKAG